MSAFILKLIAVAAMVCDHVGAVFFPSQMWLRAIGRLTMPIMAYFAAVGYRKTKNIIKYLLRLGIFSVISEPCYYLLFNEHSNVIITIFLGVASLYAGDLLIKKFSKKWVVIFPYILACIISVAINSDWSYAGVLFIIAFFYANGSRLKTVLYPLPVYALFMIQFLTRGTEYFILNLVQLTGIAALFMLCLYSGRKGPNMKYLFYFFYPVHLLIIYFIYIYA